MLKSLLITFCADIIQNQYFDPDNEFLRSEPPLFASKC